MAYGRIYVLFNERNGKVYVGQTINSVKRRWNSHCKLSVARQSHGVISSAIQKHGKENFLVQEVLETFNKESLDSLEKLWIWVLRSSEKMFGYNRTFGGDGSLTQDARNKMRVPRPATSEKLRGRHRPQYIRDILMANRQKCHSPEAREKSKRSHTGLKHSPETKLKMSIARIEFWRRKRAQRF